MPCMCQDFILFLVVEYILMYRYTIIFMQKLMGVWVIPTFGGIKNTAAVNMHVQVFEWTYVFSFLGDMYLGVELLKW